MNNKDLVYFLVGIKLPKDHAVLVEESMNELKSLVQTAGGKVVGSVIQNKGSIDPAYYIGKGKLEEIDFLFDKTEDQEGIVVFNASLSPAQIRNIEAILECRVITRTELILDIFAIHAQSQIAKIQVEKAQLAYLLPRLVGQGSSMSRTGGGIGTRGPGETKLETDRRKINRRINILDKELKKLEIASQERRKSRNQIYNIAIVGYTNAGKSHLTTSLVKEKLLVQDKLFSTLDTTTRQIFLNGLPAVVTDTVGFIRDIPHELVASFKSTLSETIDADLILHVVDISSPFFKDKIDVVRNILEDMDIHGEIQLIFNKIDLLTDTEILDLKILYPDALYISAKKQVGLNELKLFLQEKAELFMRKYHFSSPEWLTYLSK